MRLFHSPPAAVTAAAQEGEAAGLAAVSRIENCCRPAVALLCEAACPVHSISDEGFPCGLSPA